MMMKSGWCGFYLSVRRGGSIEAGQNFELIAGSREVHIAELFESLSKRKT